MAPVAHCPYPGPADCFGFVGPLDTYVCQSDNHDMRYEDAYGRRPCQAGDKRWAEPGRTACRFHREYGKAAP